MDGVWATTEDMGYDDVILVAPQYYTGNSPREDGYERDDAFRVALCYALSDLQWTETASMYPEHPKGLAAPPLCFETVPIYYSRSDPKRWIQLQALQRGKCRGDA